MAFNKSIQANISLQEKKAFVNTVWPYLKEIEEWIDKEHLEPMRPVFICV